MKKALLLFFISISFFSRAQSDTTMRNDRLELSFGASKMFISESRLDSIQSKADIVLPTSAILFFAEFRPQKKIRIPVFFNLPTGSKQYVVNNVLTYEKANPTVGAGLEFTLFHIPIDKRSNIEFEMGPLASVIFGKHNVRAAPVLAGRFRIARGENFTMYIGSSYSFGINAFSLLYGTGTIL